MELLARLPKGFHGLGELSGRHLDCLKRAKILGKIVIDGELKLEAKTNERRQRGSLYIIMG
jgi:hypothetical protein